MDEAPRGHGRAVPRGESGPFRRITAGRLKPPAPLEREWLAEGLLAPGSSAFVSGISWATQFLRESAREWGDGAPDPEGPILRLLSTHDRAAEKSRVKELLALAQSFLLGWLLREQGLFDEVFSSRLTKIAREVVRLGLSLAEYQRRVMRLVRVFELGEAIGKAWYESTIRQPFGRGKDTILQSPEGIELAPYRRLVTMGDDRVRPNHWALHGFVARVDWEMWDQRYAEPLGYGCRCQSPPVSAAEARALGYVGDFPLGRSFLERRMVEDPRTGKMVLVDPGPDPGYHRLFLDVAA